jgi:hypothetical protein
MLALGVPYAIVLGVLAFFMEFVPILGVLISGGVCVLIALTQGWLLAVVVLAYFVVVHVIEGDVVGPRIMGRAVGIHPMTAIIALLAGTELFGIWGALFGAPLAGLLQALATAFWQELRAADSGVGQQDGTEEPGEAAPQAAGAIPVTSTESVNQVPPALATAMLGRADRSECPRGREPAQDCPDDDGEDQNPGQRGHKKAECHSSLRALTASNRCPWRGRAQGASYHPRSRWASQRHNLPAQEDGGCGQHTKNEREDRSTLLAPVASSCSIYRTRWALMQSSSACIARPTNWRRRDTTMPWWSGKMLPPTAVATSRRTVMAYTGTEAGFTASYWKTIAAPSTPETISRRLPPTTPMASTGTSNGIIQAFPPSSWWHRTTPRNAGSAWWSRK